MRYLAVPQFLMGVQVFACSCWTTASYGEKAMRRIAALTLVVGLLPVLVVGCADCPIHRALFGPSKSEQSATPAPAPSQKASTPSSETAPVSSK
jgi:hypothetical protein